MVDFEKNRHYFLQKFHPVWLFHTICLLVFIIFPRNMFIPYHMLNRYSRVHFFVHFKRNIKSYLRYANSYLFFLQNLGGNIFIALKVLKFMEEKFHKSFIVGKYVIHLTGTRRNQSARQRNSFNFKRLCGNF